MQSPASLTASPRPSSSTLPISSTSLPTSGTTSTGTWLDRYLDYAEEITDSPRLFHKFSALTVLGAAMGNRVFFRFGDQHMRPNLWTLIIAPSSAFRKSTALAISQRIYEASLPGRVFPAEFSSEAFFELLDAHPVGCLFSSEFLSLVGSLKREYNAGLVAFLSDLYDCPPQPLVRRLRRNTYTIEKPSLNILAATTIEWFTEKLKPEDLAGGFIPRFLIVPYRGKKERTLALPPAADMNKRERLVAELALFADCYGEFHMPPESRAYYESWYRDFSNRDGLPTLFAGSGHRMAIQAIKLAMIYTALKSRGSVRGDTQIEIDPLTQACADIDELHAALVTTATREVSFNRYEKDRNKLLKSLEARGGELGHSPLLRASGMPAQYFRKIIETLMEAGEVLSTNRRTDKGGIEVCYSLQRKND